MSKQTFSLSIDDISVLDKQLDQLHDFKPIPEHEVKALCDKVSLPESESVTDFARSLCRPKKFS